MIKIIRYFSLLSTIVLALGLVSLALAGAAVPKESRVGPSPLSGYIQKDSSSDPSIPTSPPRIKSDLSGSARAEPAPTAPLTLGEVLTWFTPPGGGLPVGLEHNGNGSLYMTEVADDRVHLIDTNGNELSSFPLTPPQTYNGVGVTTDGEYLYLTDTSVQEVDRYSLGGAYLSSFSVFSQTIFPEGITYNPGTGDLYVVDGNYNEPPEIVAEFSISGALSTTYNLPSGAANGLAYDPLRCTYWTYDSSDDTVQHLSPSFGFIESFPGTQAAGFSAGEGVAVINNILYVAAKNSNKIVAFDISAADTTYAGQCTSEGTLTGQVTSATSGLGLPGAAIEASDGITVFSAIADGSGFYTLTLMPGSYTVTASLSGYSPVTEVSVEIFSGMAVLNFALPASGLTATPQRIESWISPGEIVTHSLTLSNSGQGIVSYQILLLGQDTGWVNAEPLTGTIQTGAGQLVEVHFDSTMVSSTGTYTATLLVEGDFENEPPEVDLVMHVNIQVFLPVLRKQGD